jgi:hypothetical protein
MVEHYLGTVELQKLNEALPYYKKNRTKGVNAAIIAEKTGLPLKDVISFLIDKNELKGEQIDLEFARVMLYKNIQLQKLITENHSIAFKQLDHALAKEDEKFLRKLCNRREIDVAYSIVPSFAVSAGVLGMPYQLAVTLCLVFIGIILTETLMNFKPKSNVDLMLKIFEGC